MSKYIQCRETDIPAGVRFDTPRHLAGQIIEVSYGTFGRHEACSGDPWKRVTDRSCGEVTYYRLGGV